jgi:Protein of unknown function (DUF3309)
MALQLWLGYAPSGVIGVVLVVIVISALTGRL